MQKSECRMQNEDQHSSFCIHLRSDSAVISLMRVLHLSTADSGGGAFRAAFRLHTGLRRLGVDSNMLVLKKGSGDPNVAALKPGQGFFRRTHANVSPEKSGATITSTMPPSRRASSRSAMIGPNYWRNLAEQLPPADLINLHWIGGFVDWTSFFWTIAAATCRSCGDWPTWAR